MPWEKSQGISLKVPMNFHEILLNDYNNAAIYNDKVPQLNTYIRQILANQIRYKVIASSWGAMPFLVPGFLHLRECSLNFTEHLANGDPLSGDTVNVPANLMAPLPPPYNFEQAAYAAIKNFATGWNVDLINYEWNLANTLWFFQAWHGFGALEKGFKDTYLVNWTNLATPGDYIGDGQWDSTLVDLNPGCMALMKISGAF